MYELFNSDDHNKPLTRSRSDLALSCSFVLEEIPVPKNRLDQYLSRRGSKHGGLNLRQLLITTLFLRKPDKRKVIRL